MTSQTSVFGPLTIRNYLNHVTVLYFTIMSQELIICFIEPLSKKQLGKRYDLQYSLALLLLRLPL